MTTPMLDMAVQMARDGKSIADIHTDLGLDYWEVWNHIRTSGGTDFSSWRGAKWIVTHRLNLLVKEKDPSKRQELSDQAKECAKYIYEEGQRLSRKIHRARKELA